MIGILREAGLAVAKLVRKYAYQRNKPSTVEKAVRRDGPRPRQAVRARLKSDCGHTVAYGNSFRLGTQRFLSVIVRYIDRKRSSELEPPPPIPKKQV